MARTVDESAKALRRDEFLDAAQRLLESKGYEQMSVQDVLAAVGASKGAFYHYFDSKQSLLEAVVERLADRTAVVLEPVVGRQEVAALDKLAGFFAALAGWKLQRRDLLAALLNAWYSDDNALLRQKLRAGIAERIAPLVARIIEEGVQQHVFTAAHPEQFGRVVVSLIQDLNDRLAELMLAAQRTGVGEFAQAEHAVVAYTQALERMLAAPPGSITLVDPAKLRPWFQPSSKGSRR
ncbi:TetR/AcrR family transcriptional regulator [Hamadaea sp. NPDC050747]|uniref:TetR/AcrR family transcriptional regulator n=1 Tax=Hamadaea sp. NPDC050747 TaxID=3155789 RepID=UPI0033D601F6